MTNDFEIKISRELGEVCAEIKSLRDEIRKGHDKIDIWLGESKEQLKAIWEKIDSQNHKIRALEDKNLVFDTEVKSLGKGTKWVAAGISVIISFLVNWKKIFGVFL